MALELKVLSSIPSFVFLFTKDFPTNQVVCLFVFLFLSQVVCFVFLFPVVCWVSECLVRLFVCFVVVYLQKKNLLFFFLIKKSHLYRLKVRPLTFRKPTFGKPNVGLPVL